jgi:putative ABC transport system permease protein
VAEQACLDDLGVVEHQQVARLQQAGQFAEDAVAGRGLQGVEQARGAAFGGRLLGEGDLANNFALAAERGQVDRVLEATQRLPRVAGVFSKANMLRNMQEVSARNVLIMSTILTMFATVIAVGVVYNNARIALAERTWELASLRVLGFTRAEVSALLLGELALSIALALPLGFLLGWGLTHLIVGLVASDQFQFPVVIQARTYAWAAVAVVTAGIASAAVVRRRIDRLDMVSALKTRE